MLGFIYLFQINTHLTCLVKVATHSACMNYRNHIGTLGKERSREAKSRTFLFSTVKNELIITLLKNIRMSLKDKVNTIHKKTDLYILKIHPFSSLYLRSNHLTTSLFEKVYN